MGISCPSRKRDEASWSLLVLRMSSYPPCLTSKSPDPSPNVAWRVLNVKINHSFWGQKGRGDFKIALLIHQDDKKSHKTKTNTKTKPYFGTRLEAVRPL